MTKVEYEAISVKDPDTIYLIEDDSTVTSIPNYSTSDANKVLAVSSDGISLAWIDAPSGSGTGLTSDQINKLQTAYDHSQSMHIGLSDIPTKISQLTNDSDFSTKDYVNQQISEASLSSDASFRDTNSGEIFSVSRVPQYAEVSHGLFNNSNINEGSSITIKVRLKKRINCVQTINISSNSEYLVIDKPQLTFNRKNYYNIQHVKLTAIEDSTSTEDKTVVLSFTNPDTSTVQSVTLILKNVSSSTDPVSVTGVQLDKSITEVPINDNITLTATISPSNATNKNVTFSSNNENVSISQSGLTATVTGNIVGSSIITVRTEDGNHTAQCSVTVTDIPQGSYVTDGLTNMYDLTQYEDGYTGEVRDSINNNLLTVKGQEAYTTGRCGFIDGKFMLNPYVSDSKLLYSSLAIPSVSAPTTQYPHSIEVYTCMRWKYDAYQPNNTLVMDTPAENTILTLIDTRSTDDAPNGAKGSWIQYNLTSNKFIINQTLSSIYVESEPVESNLCATSSDDELVFTHIVAVLDSNNQRLYVNGTNVIDNNGKALDLSDKNSAINFATCGDIKLIRTYERALTQEEVVQNYNDVINTMR